MRFPASVRSAGIAIILALGASGCATVTLYGDSGQARPAAERLALNAAVEALSDTPWPQPEKSSLLNVMGGVLFGDGGDGERMTEDRAVQIYLASAAKTAPDVSTVVDADAQALLRAALQVSMAADAAAYAPVASKDDVEVLETAIADLRESRDMFVRAYRSLQKDGAPVADARITHVKTAFSSAMKEIGASADIIAERTAKTGDQPAMASDDAAHRRRLNAGS